MSSNSDLPVLPSKSSGDDLSKSFVVRANPSGPLPPGVVPLTPQEVVDLQTARIESWRPQQDVWPLRHGDKLVSLVASVTAAATVSKLRVAFQLSHQKMLFSLVPTVLLTSFMTRRLHQSLLTDRLLLEDRGPGCSVCYATRGAVVQAAGTTVGGSTIALVACFAAASVERTYPLPSPWDVRGVARLGVRILGQHQNLLLVSAGVSLLFGAWLTHREMETNLRMRIRDQQRFAGLHQ